jgi:hypothetical protein
VKSIRSKKFKELFAKLPREIQETANDKYKVFKENPYHPGLHFKSVSARSPIYSVRINDVYRALGRRDDDDTIVWQWIGKHSEYDKRL